MGMDEFAADRIASEIRWITAPQNSYSIGISYAAAREVNIRVRVGNNCFDNTG